MQTESVLQEENKARKGNNYEEKQNRKISLREKNI